MPSELVAIAGIRLYPIKSLDGIDVGEARVLSNGSLENDRRFALTDAQGRFVNGKRFPSIHRVRTEYDLGALTATVWVQDAPESRETFSLESELPGLAQRLTRHFGFDVRIQESRIGGFPDDSESPGLTIVSTASLAAVAEWYDGLSLEESRRRFRANVELDASIPFWEDRLAGELDETRPVKLGAVRLLGVNPCQRCAVPTRSSSTGEAIPGFAAQFAARRQGTLPAWSPRSRFDHFYRLAINTRTLDGQPGVIRVGDPVSVLE